MAALPILFAYDQSGSTGGQAFYWDHVKNIYHQAKAKAIAEGRTLILLKWDDKATVSFEEELLTLCNQRRGGGGTYPVTIFNFLETFVRDLPYPRPSGEPVCSLVLITDGQVEPQSVTACNDKMAKMDPPLFCDVEAYLIGSGAVNESVTAPFSRKTTCQIFQLLPHQPIQVVQQVTAADQANALNTIATISTLAEFTAAYPLLYKVVVNATMGTSGDAPLRDALLALQRRLVASSSSCGDLGTQLYDALTNGFTDTAETLVKSIVAEHQGSGISTANPMMTNLTKLIAATQGALKTSFGNHDIALQRAASSVAVPAPAASSIETAMDTDIPPTFTFECPIALDDASSNIVLLVKQSDKSLLAGLDKGLVEQIVACPLILNAHHMEEVLVGLLQRLDHPIGLHALKDAEEADRPILTSPLTRAPLLRGGLCLGAHRDHVRATNATLAAAIADGKSLGNMDLYFAVIYLTFIWRPDLVPGHLLDILPAIRSHLQFRLRTSTSYASLSGLVGSVTKRIPLGAAIWFCVGGAQVHEEMQPGCSALRTHITYRDSLLALCGTQGFEIGQKAHTFGDGLKVAMKMLRLCKKGPNSHKAVLEAVRGLYQRTVATGNATECNLRRRIPLDGPALGGDVNEIRSFFDAASPEMLVHVAKQMDPNKASSDLRIDATAVMNVPLSESQWRPLPTGPDGAVYTPSICPATHRPYYHPRDRAPGTTWKDSAQSTFGINPLDLVPICRYYMDYVGKFDKFPACAEDLLEYVASRVFANARFKGKTTLPHTCFQDCQDVIHQFQKARLIPGTTHEFTPKSAYLRFQKSCSIDARVQMEALLIPTQTVDAMQMEE